jgi:hypothetical protein
MLLPTLAKAKKKANRLKCSNNLSQQGKAHIGFASDAGSFISNLLDRDILAAYAADYRDNAPRTDHNLHSGAGHTWEPFIGDNAGIAGKVKAGFVYVRNHHNCDVRFVFTAPGVRRSLDSSKMLLSPSDAKQKAGNQADSTRGNLDGGKWASGSFGTVGGWFAGYYVHDHAVSYAVHNGADDQVPEGILGYTRNCVGNQWQGSRTANGYHLAGNAWLGGSLQSGAVANQWVGADGKDATSSGSYVHIAWKHVWLTGANMKISGLDANQGNYTKADGSATQGDDAQWQEAIGTHNANKSSKSQGYDTPALAATASREVSRPIH